MNRENNPAKIIVVDDAPAILTVLKSTLEIQGYQVRAFLNGEDTLEAVFADPPDLILLDISMPEMDGYEVCKRLKNSEMSKKIPVIFLTSLSETEAEIKGFEIGAVDFIVKPMKMPIVAARVKVHLELLESRRQIERQNKELLKAAELKENIEQITKHDLKSPLTVIVGLSDIMLEDTSALSKEKAKQINLIKESGYRILEIINRSLDLFKMENGKYKLNPTKVDLLLIIKKIARGFCNLSRAKELKLMVMIDEHVPKEGERFEARGEEFLCYSLLLNLIKNAIEASPNGENVRISCTREKDMAGIEILNKGSVPEDIRDIFFKKFSTSGKDSGTGLGTYSAKLTTEIQQGKIALDCSLAGETKVIVKLPKADN